MLVAMARRHAMPAWLGHVLVRDHDGREQVLADPGRDLERELVDAMESALDPGMLELLRGELS